MLLRSGAPGAAAAAAGRRSHCPSSSPLHQLQQRRRAHTTQQQRGSAAAAAASRFGGQASGPFGFSTLPTIRVPLGQSPNDVSTPLDMQLEVLVPEGRGGCPLAVLSPGFLLNSSLYRTYAARLASWGFAVVLWDLSEVLDDTLTGAYMRQLLDVCAKDARLRPHCDTTRLLLCGHSRGAKLSCLLAQQDPRVRGLVLIDPVDNSPFGPQGVGYPSSLPALTAAASDRQLPVLVIGAALNTDVVPPEANWRQFVAAAAAGGAPVWEVVLQGAAHLQFLDRQQPLFSLFSNKGPTPDETVRDVTQAAMLAFSQLAVCPREPLNGSAVQTLLAEEGTALARLAPLTCSFKNWDQLHTASSSSGGASSSSSRGGVPPPPPPPPPPPRQQQQQQQQQYGQAGRAPPKPVQADAAALMAMRVSELKRLLVEHGVDGSDCFEKADLVQRVLDRCTTTTPVA